MFNNSHDNEIHKITKNDADDLSTTIELHHTVTDLLPSEMIEVLNSYLNMNLSILHDSIGEAVSVENIEFASATLSVCIVPLEEWGSESPCSQFSFNVIFSDRYKYLSLVTLNDINKNINGIKVYRDKDNLIATCFVDIAYGVTAQTMINQINHLIETSERLQLSLFDETNQVVN